MGLAHTHLAEHPQVPGQEAQDILLLGTGTHQLVDAGHVAACDREGETVHLAPALREGWGGSGVRM